MDITLQTEYRFVQAHQHPHALVLKFGGREQTLRFETLAHLHGFTQQVTSALSAALNQALCEDATRARAVFDEELLEDIESLLEEVHQEINQVELRYGANDFLDEMRSLIDEYERRDVTDELDLDDVDRAVRRLRDRLSLAKKRYANTPAVKPAPPVEVKPAPPVEPASPSADELAAVAELGGHYTTRTAFRDIP